MNASVVYKYRTCHGIVEYKVISGEYGIDSTLHLQDTSCTHAGPKCEIEVEKCDDGGYQYSKPLNDSAKEYDYFHKLEKFWATKKEAFIEMLLSNIASNIKNIADDEKHIKSDEEKLKKLNMDKGDIRYITPENVKVGSGCYIENVGFCRIIGSILFEDGKKGFLTDSNYYNEDRFCDYDGDRIILIEDSTGRILTETEDVVYVSKTDFENLKTKNEITRTEKTIDNYKKRVERLKGEIELCESIIDIKDTLTFDQMFEMRFGNKK
jgi:hypothetical protein